MYASSIFSGVYARDGTLRVSSDYRSTHKFPLTERQGSFDCTKDSKISERSTSSYSDTKEREESSGSSTRQDAEIPKQGGLARCLEMRIGDTVTSYAVKRLQSPDQYETRFYDVKGFLLATESKGDIWKVRIQIQTHLNIFAVPSAIFSGLALPLEACALE